MRERRKRDERRSFWQLLLAAVLLATTHLSAQTPEDTVRLNSENISVVVRKEAFERPNPFEKGRSMLLKYEETRVAPKKIDVNTHPAFALPIEPQIPYYTDPTPIHRGDYSTGGIIHQFRRGALVGAGEQTTMPALGRMNEASIGYIHALSDRLFLQVGLSANKFQIGTNIGEAFGTTASMLYQASDKVGFRLFGHYNFGNSLYMQSNSYGATMLYNFSNRFTLEAGAQRVYQPMRGGWETVPVVIPQYKVNKNVTIGMDVGGLIYEIIRSASYRRDDFQMGPTIRPPRPPFQIP